MYAEPPFNGVVVGRDKILEFYTDHGNKLIQAVGNGAPFDDLVDPYMQAVNSLADSKTSTAVNMAQQGSETMTVDKLITQFKDDVTRLEFKVLVQFAKDSVEYHEFFPQGKTAYHNITKGNIDNHFATIIQACTKHSAKLGPEPAAQFTTLKNSYNIARASQLQKKGNTESTRSDWETNLELVSDLAFYNLLTIAREYRGNPDKLRMFFDQSIITPRKHAGRDQSTDDAYTLTIPAAATAVANISFSPDDTLLVSNTGDVSVYYFGAATANGPTPDAPTEIEPGDEAEITAAMLGAPANKFLLFVNTDETTDGEVEITLI